MKTRIPYTELTPGQLFDARPINDDGVLRTNHAFAFLNDAGDVVTECGEIFPPGEYEFLVEEKS